MNDQQDTKHKTDDLAAFSGVVVEQLPALSKHPLPTSNRVFGAQPVAMKRDEYRVLADIRRLAASYGDGWLYSFPVSEEGHKKTITGATIKLANDIARVYGNCDVDCRAEDMGDRWMLHARFIDLETGFSMTRPFEQPKSGAKLKTKDPERKQAMALQIGASKAIRNVIVNALQSLTDFAQDEAKASVVEKIAGKLEFYRDKVTGRLEELAIPLRKVELSIGRPMDRWTDRDLARVISEIQAIAEGMSTAEEVFGVVQPDVPVVEAVETKKARKKAEPKVKAQKPARAARKGATGGKKAKEAPKPTPAPTEPAAAPVKAKGKVTRERKVELTVRTMLFKAGSAEAAAEIWAREVAPFEWTAKEMAKLQAVYDERKGK